MIRLNIKNPKYITGPVFIVAFIFLFLTIFNYAGVINFISDNFYVYINQDTRIGVVAGEKTCNVESYRNNLNTYNYTMSEDQRVIQTAIDECGSGDVVLKSGKTYTTGPILLKNNINLDLNGATISGSTDPAHYPDPRATYHTSNHYLIVANQKTNTGVTGPGKIIHNVAGYYGSDDDNLNPNDVDIGGIMLNRSQNVWIRGVSGSQRLEMIGHSVGYHAVVGRSNGAVVEYVSVTGDMDSGGTDGIDIQSSSNVTYEDVYLNTYDDPLAIVAHGGFNTEHVNLNNITIDVNLIGAQHGAGSLKFGSGSQDNFCDINMTNVRVKESLWGLNFLARGPGVIDGVNFKNSTIETDVVQPFNIGCYVWGCEACSYTVKNLTIKNIDIYRENKSWPYSFGTWLSDVSEIGFMSYDENNGADIEVENVNFENVTYHLSNSFNLRTLVKFRKIKGTLCINNFKILQNGSEIADPLSYLDYSENPDANIIIDESCPTFSPQCGLTPTVDDNSCDGGDGGGGGGGDEGGDGDGDPPDPVQEIAADFNNDKEVNIQDFGILLSNWYKRGNEIENKRVDLVEDDIINKIDLATLLSCWGKPTNSQCFTQETWEEEGLRAFPGAQGFGSETVGGRGGQVIEVTNLNDNGPGSLREAIETLGPRIVVFRVGGTIELESDLDITEPYITIAGQTAPGGGITIKAKGETSIRSAHDVIIRYVRFRGVQKDNQDCLNIVYGAYNIVIDHCSLSWCRDESLSVVAQSHDVTFQWNIISEALDYIDYKDKKNNGKGSLVSSGSYNVSAHHNLYAHNSERNAKMNGSDDPFPLEGNIPYFDFVNNVIYNWGGYAHSVAGSGKGNVIANYFKPGLNSGSYPRRREIIRQQWEEGRQIYSKNNIGPTCPQGCENDWEGETFIWNGQEYTGGMISDISGDINPQGWGTRTDTPMPTPPIRTHSAEQAYEKVLNQAGVSVPKRDSVDIRIINDVKNGTGKLISDQSEVGGWPVLSSGTPPTDTDHDGMSDSWEDSNGLDKNDPSDNSLDKDGDGYTNIEEYLNSLVD
jgi:pectate lyase